MNHRFDDILQFLVCPVCKEQLDFSQLEIRCTSCELRFPQNDEDCLNLLPSHPLGNDGIRWAERQEMMVQWYKDLFATSWASASLARDYDPYARLLSSYFGVILDIGGGAGIVRHYLTSSTRYILIDPSPFWRTSVTDSIADQFPSLPVKASVIKGLGERLPFADQVFDSALAFWTINHVNQPKEVFREVSRVIRSGGRFLVALEDMEPTWLDLMKGVIFNFSTPSAIRVLKQKYRHCLLRESWPVADDHISVTESDIRRWISPYFEVTLREWIGRYLTYEFKKCDSRHSES